MQRRLLLALLVAACLLGAAMARPKNYGNNRKNINRKNNAVNRGGEDDYNKVLTLAYTFYESQMSGKLPKWNRVSAENGGWRHSAHLSDGKNLGVDLSGGFYDAGDYLKCPHSLGWTIANLAFSAMEFRRGYEAAGEWDAMINNIKWAADWLIKAHIKASDDPAENVFVGQLGGRLDHWFFGRPEHATNERKIWLANKDIPGADLAGEYAAGYAAAATLFRGLGQPEYAEKLWGHAKQAYAFATAFKENWKTSDGAFQAYPSYWPEGHLAQILWGAAWMCKYGGGEYCDETVKYWNECMTVNNIKYALGYDWDTVLPGAAALIVSIKLKPIDEVAKGLLEGYMLSKWQDTSSKCPKESYANVCYTPKGLAYYADWGTLRASANAAFISALMAKYGDNKLQNICWARSQIRYILGSSTGKSYLIGYGPDQPKRPHHRGAACAFGYHAPCKHGINSLNEHAGPGTNGTCCAGEGSNGKPCCDAENFNSETPSPIKVVGGLVGGPDQSDDFPDKRPDYQRSEVALDYNAGFTGVIAALASWNTDGSLGSKCAALANAPVIERVQDWSKCGGAGDGCPPQATGPCTDAPWPGLACPSGQICVRHNANYWGCHAAVPS